MLHMDREPQGVAGVAAMHAPHGPSACAMPAGSGMLGEGGDPEPGSGRLAPLAYGSLPAGGRSPGAWGVAFMALLPCAPHWLFPHPSAGPRQCSSPCSQVWLHPSYFY